MRPTLLLRCLLLLCLFTGPARAADPLPLVLPNLKARSIGPAVMSGRIPDVAVYDKDPSLQYVAAASGGVWKTTNYGTTWKPVFDTQPDHAIGAVAIAPSNPDIVWVGTGEANPRNSVSWGHGVYKSTDGGKSWKNMGLKDSHHIGRVVIHPTNPDIVYVAALGHAWAANKERGVFKTSDGGKSWEHSLALDADTGCVDLAMDPSEPDLLYTCAYAVRRDAFSGGNPVTQIGPKAGIYRSKDAGKTWDKLTNGLPLGPFGRCGVSVYAKDPKVVYAVVQTDKTSVTVQGQPANTKLTLAAGGIFRSDDKGETWKHLNSLCPRPFYYGQIRVDPSDDRRIYVLGIQFHQSNDGGKTFLKGNSARNTHSDYHALWIDPKNSRNLVLGCDGGLNYSFDRANTWEHLKNLPISQFYAVTADTRTPYRVYGGLQDNGSWGGPSATDDSAGISTADWTNILGFDGYYCQVDPDDPGIVFAEGQYGILRRINLRTWESAPIKPVLTEKGTKTNVLPAGKAMPPAFRFNWSSPILLSKTKGKPLYFGGNFLFRSDDRGQSWTIISPDLTRGKPGVSAYSGHTITTLAEAKAPGLIYAGTDDGNLQVTRDGGKSWEDLSANIPDISKSRWITRVECSPTEESVVYLSIDRHRHDDFKPYVFKSADHGKTWTSLAKALPEHGPVHVIKVDPTDPRRLYVGTEYGLFFSMDDGKTWVAYPGLPTVPVHDLAFANKNQDLVIGTHGRGIYILDLAPLHHINAETQTLLDVRSAKATRPKATRSLGIKHFYGDNPPRGAVIDVFFEKKPETEPVLTIADKDGNQVAQLKVSSEPGFHRVVWSMMKPKTPFGGYNPVAPGRYTATLRLSPTLRSSKEFMVEVE